MRSSASANKKNLGVENGTDLRTFQILLGHSSSKNTEIYSHISYKHLQLVKGPLDIIDL